MTAIPTTASAASFTASSTADDPADPTTLRGAIAVAEANGEADVITLQSGATYTLTDAEGDLDITTEITIEGNGATIDASGLGDRAFHVLAGGDLTISDVTVTGGRPGDAPSAAGGGSGGAFLNAGTLSISGSVLDDNSADRAGGAIEASAGSTTTLANTDLTNNATGAAPGNGGGLHLTGAGTVSITGGTVSGNTAAAEGGGLWNSGAGTMTVDGTTVTGNTASGATADQGGGGLFQEAGGGTLTVRNASITENVADGAAGSGGGILNDQSAVTVQNSTISGNTSVRAGGGIEANVGTTNLSGVTLDSNSTGGSPGNGGGLHITGAGNAEITGSTVTGNTATLEGGGLWNGSGTMTVSTTEITGNTASGAGADDGGGGLFNNGGTLQISGSTIEGNEADGAAGSGGGVLTLGGTLEVTSSSIDNNTAVRAGGGIEATEGSTTTISGGSLSENVAGAGPGNGGGLHLTGAGTVDVDGVVVAGNLAANEGGGLWNSATGTMTVTSSTISNNTASGAPADAGGGGLHNDGGELSVEGSVIEGNSADGAAGSGGGILNAGGGTLTVTGTDILGNDAVRAGGGIEATGDGSVTTVSDVLLQGNSTGSGPGNGGGLHLTGAGTVTVDASLVSQNSATNQGGGLWYFFTGTMTVTLTTLTANTTAGQGGALYNVGGDLTVEGSTISANTAAVGGGVATDPGAADDATTLIQVTVTDNSTGTAGPVTLGNSILSGNDGDDAVTAVTSLGGNVVGTAVDTDDDSDVQTDDPRLGALADNGGPTPTHLPAAGSPAIEAGVDGLGDLDTDQRGFARVVGAAPDAGAVEVGAAADGGGDRAGNDGGAPAAPARATTRQPTYTG